jgi:hypothetical protein
MKRMITPNWLKTAFLGAALAASASFAFGQSGVTNNPNTFDDAASTTSFVVWWGLNPAVAWDSILDANSNPNSGSAKYTVPFTGAAGEQFATWLSIANRWGWDGGTMLDGTMYTNLAFDIKVDPSSAVTPGGNYGYLEVGLVAKPVPSDANSWSQTDVQGYTVPLSATNWTHVNMPIVITSPDLDKVVGFFIKMWSNGAHTNTLTFNIDNIGIQKPEIVVPIPPPTVSLKKPVPGLAFIAASGGQYDRQEIRTVGTSYAWYGASGPVSYSFDIVKLGESAPAGFTAFMHLVPGIPDPTRPDSDWHETNVVMFSVANNADGSAWATMRYKTNSPDNNGHLYDTGYLGGVGSSTPLGTWTITFNNDTDFTITTPSGGTLTTNLPPEAVAVFKSASPNMQINMGGVPGDLGRLGQMAVITRAKITGTPGQPNLDSNFLGQPLDTNVWAIVASSANYGVQQISDDAAYWVKWTLPAIGFSLETKATLNPGPWTSPTMTGYEVGGVHYDLFRTSDLPGSNSGYFHLIKRVATQLQVLLPGETNAPNTTTGKIGTPAPQTVGNPFDLTVNLCDATWHLVSTSTTVAFTSSDTTAWLPPNATVVNGTVTISGNTYFGSSGTWTITATDVPNPGTIAAGTSSPITIP